jgi:hypothetical protein
MFNPMATVSWPTVAVSTTLSAGVSALVTLVADYFARPGLEARKERILERHRARREFARSARQILVLASALSTDPPPDFDHAQEALYALEMTRLREEIGQAAVASQLALTSFSLDLPTRVRGPVARFAGQARGISTSDKDDQQAGRELVVIASPLVDYFDSRGWRRLLRRSYINQARALFDI